MNKMFCKVYYFFNSIFFVPDNCTVVRVIVRHCDGDSTHWDVPLTIKQQRKRKNEALQNSAASRSNNSHGDTMVALTVRSKAEEGNKKPEKEAWTNSPRMNRFRWKHTNETQNIQKLVIIIAFATHAVLNPVLTVKHTGVVIN
jgi:hypothetical protein